MDHSTPDVESMEITTDSARWPFDHQRASLSTGDAVKVEIAVTQTRMSTRTRDLTLLLAILGREVESAKDDGRWRALTKPYHRKRIGARRVRSQSRGDAAA